MCNWWTEYTCKTILSTVGYGFLLVSNYTCYSCVSSILHLQKKLSAYVVHAISFLTCTAHLDVALKHSVALTTKSETYRKLQYSLRVIFFMLNFLLVVVKAQGSIISYGNL